MNIEKTRVVWVPSLLFHDHRKVIQLLEQFTSFDLKKILHQRFLIPALFLRPVSHYFFQARGKHQNNRSLIRPPFILGLEFAGIVSSAPIGSQYSPGDRVFGSGLGSYAEQIAVNGATLHHIPKDWDFRDAAGLAATAPVSYGALITRGRLQRGETVLIHAAAGGLGAMAIQISKAVGARVIATAGSQAKLDVAKDFGADECVNYETNPEWWKEVLQLTHGKGVDVVYDPVGRVSGSLKCLKQKGRILVIGFAGTEGNIERIATNRILLRQAQIIGYVSRNKLGCLPLTFTSVSV